MILVEILPCKEGFSPVCTENPGSTQSFVSVNTQQPGIPELLKSCRLSYR